jgi:hypothetical protein
LHIENDTPDFVTDLVSLAGNRETGKNLIGEAFTDQPIQDFR